MNKKFIPLLLLLLLLLIPFLFLAASSFAAPQCGAGFELQSGVCMPVTTGLPDPVGGVSSVLATLLNWVLSILAVIAVLMIVVSGIQYITSAGNENQIETAKRNLTYSVIGLAVALSGLIIIYTITSILDGFVPW